MNNVEQQSHSSALSIIGSILNPIPMLLISVLYYLVSVVSVIKNASESDSIFQLGNEVALTNLSVLGYVILAIVAFKALFKIPVLNRFAKRNFWGLFAEPSKSLSIVLMLLPFIIFVGSYVVFSQYKTNLEPNQKLFPTVDKIAAEFTENATTPDKRIDRIAFKNVRAITKAIEAAQEQGIEEITIVHKTPETKATVKQVQSEQETAGKIVVVLESDSSESVTEVSSVSLLKWEKTKQSIMASKVYTDTISSLGILLTAMLISASIALIVGLYLGLFSAMEKTLGTFLVFFGAIQPVAILPIIMIMAGVENFGKVVFIVTVLTTTLIVGLNREVKGIPRQSIIKALTLGASQLQVIYQVILPQVFPKFLNIVKNNFYLCWIFLLASEMISAESGLGYRIMLFKRTTAMDNIIGYVIWITVLCLLIDFIIKKFNEKAYPWNQLGK